MMRPLTFLVWISIIALAGCSDNGTTAGAPFDQQKARYILALSWQPAFCETAPRKPECKSQTVDRFDARNFSLHGLWPQPGSNIYCGVDEAEIARDKKGRWRDLSTPHIAEAIWQELKKVMPGTRSALHEHEWVKHGTCYGDGNADMYYRDSLKLMGWLNASSLRNLFEANIGHELNGREIRSAFEQDFGANMGDRLRISCKRDRNSDRQMIVELTLGLAGDISAADDLSSLVTNSPVTDPGCPAGIVDPAGFQ